MASPAIIRTFLDDEQYNHGAFREKWLVKLVSNAKIKRESNFTARNSTHCQLTRHKLDPRHIVTAGGTPSLALLSR